MRYLLQASNTNPNTTTPKNAPITITDNSAVDIVNAAAGALVGRLDGVKVEGTGTENLTELKVTPDTRALEFRRLGVLCEDLSSN